MTDTTEETPDAPATGPDTTGQPEADTWTPPDKSEWDRLREKADRREALLREAQATIAKLSKPDTTPDAPEEKPDETPDKLRQGIVRTAARAVLAGEGIKDKAEQDRVLAVLNLSGITVDDEGEADTEALGKSLAELRRILAPAPNQRRTPALDPRDRGGEPQPQGDSGRYRQFITGSA